MGISNYHDAMTVVGMNRIRAGYLELAPELERYFVMGTTDDQPGVSRTMAIQPETSLIVQLLASTPMLVTFLDGMLAAVILSLLALQMGGSTVLALAVGAVGFAVVLVFSTWYAQRDIARTIAEDRPVFPSREP